jgi:colicin import membrane protein
MLDEKTITTAIAQYNITDAAIGQLRQEYMGLEVKGLDDKKGFDAVHTARIFMVKKRTDVEKTRKMLKEDALKYGQAVDQEAKRITGLMAPIEEHLTAEENKVTVEKQRIKEKAEREAAEKLQARVNRLQFDYGMKFDGQNYRQTFTDPGSPIQGYVMPNALIGALSDEQFEQICGEIYKKELAERERRAVIDAKLKEQEAERERVRKAEDERLEKVRKEQAAAQAKIDAENKRIADEKAKLEAEKKAIVEAKYAEEMERKRLADLEQARIEAAAKAKADAEAKAKADQEERERIERELKEKEEREEALRPDKEKLLQFATDLEIMDYPKVNTDAGRVILSTIADDVTRLIKKIRKQVREL